MGDTKMPECRMHKDCFANRGGRCVCLKSNDFGGRGCPFYKPAAAVREEKDGRRSGGKMYGDRNV